MDLQSLEESFSDDEVFFGKLTLKEIKRHIFLDRHRQTLSSFNAVHDEQVDRDNSLCLIETHSEPDIYYVQDFSTTDLTSSPDRCSININNSNSNVSALEPIDRFNKPSVDVSEVLDSTPDVIEFIANNDLEKDSTCNNSEITEPILMKINSPDLKSTSSSEIVCSPFRNDSDESFIKMESMVSKLCMSTQDSSQALDSTLEVVDYILKNKSSKDGCNGMNETKRICLDLKGEEGVKPTVSSGTVSTSSDNSQVDIDMCDNKHNIHNHKVGNSEWNNENIPIHLKTELKHDANKTPCKNNNCTPANKLIQNHVFKTPKNLSCQKSSATSLKKTPGKSNAYEHITSPIASYIKNCPQAPLFKKVDPKKPLPGISNIPKLKTPLNNKLDNKENIQLPSLAYKSAKKTKMISVPDKVKIPQVQWIKKFTATLPKPAVIKHDHRQIASETKASQEDSFANLPVNQAELSVCTTKSAF